MLPNDKLGNPWHAAHAAQVHVYLHEAVLLTMREQEQLRGLPTHAMALQGGDGGPDPMLTRLHHSGDEHLTEFRRRWNDLCTADGGADVGQVLNDLATEIKQRQETTGITRLRPASANKISLANPQPATVPRTATANLDGLAPVIAQAVAAGIKAGLAAAQSERN